jgi:hypothetical protein
MTSLPLLLLCVAPGSEAGAPATDFATNLRLAATTTHAPLSPEWAMSYYQAPRLVNTPAPVDVPSPASAELSPEQATIAPETASADDANLIWHDWKMMDMSLEWGLATIGPGVLAPQRGQVASRPGGGAPGGGGRQAGQAGTPTFIFVPGPPSTPTPTPTPQPPGPGVEPVPEVNAAYLWLILFAAALVGVNRWNNPPGVVASPVPA